MIRKKAGVSRTAPKPGSDRSEARSSARRSIRCTATCADGSPCRAWSVHDTDPPRCAPHGGGESPVGAPKGNQNARTHGFYAATGVLEEAQQDVPSGGWTIETIIADLSVKQARLSRYIDRLQDDEVDPRTLAGLLRLHGENASRLGRLLKVQQALRGDRDDWYNEVLNQALDEVSEELGVEL